MCEAGEIVELGGEEVKKMGVHRITSEAAKAYAARERVLGSGISILGYAAERVSELEKETLEKCGDAAGNLLPYAPGTQVSSCSSPQGFSGHSQASLRKRRKSFRWRNWRRSLRR